MDTIAKYVAEKAPQLLSNVNLRNLIQYRSPNSFCFIYLLVYYPSNKDSSLRITM